MGNYLDRLIEDSSSQSSINILLARGFLLEQRDGSIILSDNSHEDDILFLGELCQRYEFGEANKEKIIINKGKNVEFCDNEMNTRHSIPMEICQSERNWWHFKSFSHGKKVPVRFLEPFIARYIKAISACGVFTVGSCDGNHPQSRSMYLQLDGTPSVVWHSAMWKYCLEQRFSLNWNKDYTEILFNKKSKHDVYEIVNNASEYIYDHRFEFRDIRESALCDLSRAYLRREECSEEISRLFTQRVSRRLCRL